MQTIVIQNNTDSTVHIRGVRAADGGQETTFHVMPRARATLKADKFFDLNNLPKNVSLVKDSSRDANAQDYAKRKAAANQAPAPAQPEKSNADKGSDKAQK